MGARTGVGGLVVAGSRLRTEREAILDSENIAFFSASVNGTGGPTEDLGL